MTETESVAAAISPEAATIGGAGAPSASPAKFLSVSDLPPECRRVFDLVRDSLREVVE